MRDLCCIFQLVKKRDTRLPCRSEGWEKNEKISKHYNNINVQHSAVHIELHYSSEVLLALAGFSKVQNILHVNYKLGLQLHCGFNLQIHKMKQTKKYGTSLSAITATETLMICEKSTTDFGSNGRCMTLDGQKGNVLSLNYNKFCVFDKSFWICNSVSLILVCICVFRSPNKRYIQRHVLNCPLDLFTIFGPLKFISFGSSGSTRGPS